MLSEMAAPDPDQGPAPDQTSRAGPARLPPAGPGAGPTREPDRRRKHGPAPDQTDAGSINRRRTRSACSAWSGSRTRPASTSRTRTRSRARTGGRCWGRCWGGCSGDCKRNCKTRQPNRTGSRTRTRGPRRTRRADPLGLLHLEREPDPPGLLHLDRQPDPARARPEPAQPRRTAKPRPRKIQHIRARARIKTAPACVGTPWTSLVACGSVSAGFF